MLDGHLGGRGALDLKAQPPAGNGPGEVTGEDPGDFHHLPSIKALEAILHLG